MTQTVDISEAPRLLDIPRPTLASLRNATPFRHFQAQKMGKGRVFFDTVTLKGTFDLGEGTLAFSKEQAPITLSDEYHDETDAARSSVKLPGELMAMKPTTDVIVTGHARAKGKRPAFHWECAVTVRRGGVALCQSRAIATGPRHWAHRALRGWRLSDPAPTMEVPIRYELAYGGHYLNPKYREGDSKTPRVAVCRTNPCGSGFFDEASLDRNLTFRGPQWELADRPIRSINSASPLVGFGPVARMWGARVAHAGTYDDAWLKGIREDVARGVPADYPADFDPRFFQCAHPSLIAPAALRAGDTFELEGFDEAGTLHFALPSLRPFAEVLDRDQKWSEAPIPVDLVHIDLDARRVHVSFRMSLAGNLGKVAALITTEGVA